MTIFMKCYIILIQAVSFTSSLSSACLDTSEILVLLVDVFCVLANLVTWHEKDSREHIRKQPCPRRAEIEGIICLLFFLIELTAHSLSVFVLSGSTASSEVREEKLMYIIVQQCLIRNELLIGFVVNNFLNHLQSI
ncbi:hypothetical protein RB195_016358 [Necator americanus]|uniref:Secreted protein n=1 Tax=Necator americanus TaxID=51031 RepID=A0ABR1E8S6_NECAM